MRVMVTASPGQQGRNLGPALLFPLASRPGLGTTKPRAWWLPGAGRELGLRTDFCPPG